MQNDTRSELAVGPLLNIAGLLLIVLGFAGAVALLCTVDWRLGAALVTVAAVAGGYALATREG